MRFRIIESDYKKYTEEEILERVERYINEKLLENYFDVEIIKLTIIGSRKYNTNKEDSDLDILLEYDGNAREDDLFNLLHEDEFMVGDMVVDINPIDTKIETTAEYLEKEKIYQQNKRN